MHFPHVPLCLLALSASYGALAAPRLPESALSGNGMVKRDYDQGTKDKPASGQDGGMCMCPCGSAGAQSMQNQKMPGSDIQAQNNDTTSQDSGNSGNQYNDKGKGNTDDKGDVGYKAEMDDNDKPLKDKWMKLKEKDKSYYEAKDQKRMQEIQNKYQDTTVVISVVQIVIEIDVNNQQNQRYGMSTLMANGGKDKTTTCQMTAAEKMTVGAGSCDGEASSSSSAYKSSSSESSKYAGQDSVEVKSLPPTTTDKSSKYETKSSATPYTPSDKSSDKTSSSSAYTSKDKPPPAPTPYKTTDKTSDKPYDNTSDKPYDKTSDQPYDKTSDKPYEKPTDKPYSPPSDKSTSSDKPYSSPSDKSTSSDKPAPTPYKPADQPTPQYQPPDKPAPGYQPPNQSYNGGSVYKRQTGGAVSEVPAPFKADLDVAWIYPASQGTPKPLDGWAEVEDPAKDMVPDPKQMSCGM